MHLLSSRAAPPQPTCCRNASATNALCICSGVALGSASSLAELSSPSAFRAFQLTHCTCSGVAFGSASSLAELSSPIAPNQDPAVAAAGPKVTAAAAAVVQAAAAAAAAVVLPVPAVAAAGLSKLVAAAAVFENQPSAAATTQNKWGHSAMHNLKSVGQSTN